MNRISISEAARHESETVEIAGWLYKLRKSGKIVFRNCARWHRA